MVTNTSKNGPWISICCEPGRLYPVESRCYQNTSLPLKKLILPDIYDSNFSISEMDPAEFIPHYGIPCLETNSFYLEPYPPKNHVFYLMENGSIFINESIFSAPNYWLGINDYCFTSYDTENSTESVVFACVPSSSGDESFVSTTTYLPLFTILTGLSIPFLIATFLVYMILPEFNNIHGLILRIYIMGLVIVNTLFIIIVLQPIILCIYFIGLILQYGFLSDFFWLNVMAFDIWWTFRTMEDSSKHRNGKKFIMYSIYAWGLPALITGVGIIIDFIPTLPKGIVRPGLRASCWFSDKIGSAIYLHGPISIIIASNIVFFTLTALKIFQHSKSTARHLKRQNDQKQRFKLYLKLFFVMGMIEISQIVIDLWETSPFIHFLIDIPDALQGLTIFMIFVCKKKIIQSLLKRLRAFWSSHSKYRTYFQSTPKTDNTPMTETTTKTTSLQKRRDDITSMESNMIRDENN